MKFKLLLTLLILSLLTLICLPNQAMAAKTRTVVKKTVPAAVNPTVYVKFRSDRKAITLTFYNLQTSNSGAYELTYNGNGIDQGVVGAVLPTEGNTVSRTLLFGTCSKAVCTYHKNINNMRLKVTYKLKNGKTLIKRFTIKV